MLSRAGVFTLSRSQAATGLVSSVARAVLCVVGDRPRIRMSEAPLEAVRGLSVADPDLGFKPLLAKLRAQQPELGAATKEVREAVNALKAESEAKAAVTPPAADEGGAPSNLALSLACIGCSRLPSDMDNEREKHPVCHKCRKQKLLTTYWCGIDCPGNPGAWKLHSVFHKEVKKYGQLREDGGVCQQQTREVAEEVTRRAAQTGDKYLGLLAEGARYASKDDWRRAAKAFREVIALRPDEPYACTKPWYNAQQLGALRGGRTAVPRCQGALSGGLRGLGTGHISGLRHAEDEGVQRRGQAGVVERRGAQGAVGEGCGGGAEPCGNKHDAGCGSERALCI
eukprot:scaffold112089_cov63-Phaeocystis_antarctica.AAC.3